MAALMLSAPAGAQRRITPTVPAPGINENKDKKQGIDMTHVKEMTNADGVVILVDTVLGTEVVDSTRLLVAKGNIYPLLESATVGVNVWDGIMRVLGQQYGLVGFRGDVNLHNRYRPFVEIGFSKADFTPDGLNYTYRMGIAPYFKIGAGYNIFYNSNPDYSLCINLGYGFSNFSYSYDDVTVDEGYWHDPAHFNLPSQRVTVGYFEVGAAIRVKIAGPISAGWSVVYHRRLHESHTPYGPPVIIPGYGKRDGALAVSAFVSYTLPLSKRPEPTEQQQ